MLMRRTGRDPDQPAPGIRRHGAGYQVRVKVRGETSAAQFPRDATVSEMTEWQEDERARLRILLPKTKAGTFAADAKRYIALPAVQAMPTAAERTQHVHEWVAVFGQRRRRTIPARDIEAQRDRWLTEPREVNEQGDVVLGPYSAAAINKRLRALSNIWTRLDGRRAPNPVLEVDECEEPDPQPRGLPYEVIEAILAAIPETAIGVKKDGTRTSGKNIPRPSLTKARLRVIAYTGLAHAQLKALDRGDVTLFPLDADGHETGGTMRVIARRKGRKKRRAQDRRMPRLIPLIPPAAAAFRQLDRLNGWGNFSNSSMWKAFQRACRTLGIDGLRPYDFRHSLLTVVYQETKDRRVTGHFGGHETGRTTDRYTMAAVAPHVQAAADRVAARLSTVSGHQRNGTERNSSGISGGQNGGPSPEPPSKSP
jgi:integrase